MKTYCFMICFGEGKWATGTYNVTADSREEAEEKVAHEVGDKLYHAFPELDIEYSWDLLEII